MRFRRTAFWSDYDPFIEQFLGCLHKFLASCYVFLILVGLGFAAHLSRGHYARDSNLESGTIDGGQVTNLISLENPRDEGYSSDYVGDGEAERDPDGCCQTELQQGLKLDSLQ